MTRNEAKHLPTPRDPGIGIIRRRVLGDRPVSGSLAYWRQRAAQGEQERWRKIEEQHAIELELKRQGIA